MYMYLSIKCTVLLVHVTELDNWLTNSVHGILEMEQSCMSWPFKLLNIYIQILFTDLQHFLKGRKKLVERICFTIWAFSLTWVIILITHLYCQKKIDLGYSQYFKGLLQIKILRPLIPLSPKDFKTKTTKSMVQVYDSLLTCIISNYSVSAHWIWVGYNHLISNEREWNKILFY